MNGTREQLLDVAERLFADRGVAAVSLRDITTAASANVAAVNYHFGSKENLVREVFARRLEPINAERLRLLDYYESRSKSGNATLEQVMFAFVHPVIRLMLAQPERGGSFVKLMGHVHSDSGGGFAGMVIEDMRGMIERFIAAAAKAVPTLALNEIYWRAHFAVGAMAHTASAATLLNAFAGGRCSIDSAEELSYRLVAFIVGGFKTDGSRVAAALRRTTPPEVLS